MLNIAIAEDDKDDFLLLKEALEDVLPKFTISHSTNGVSFLQSMLESPVPDLVFLDLNMPKKSGLDCLIEMRKQRRFRPVPVIIYSTSSDIEDIDLCYKNGCTLYLVKPVTFSHLVTQVRKIFFRLGLPKKELLSKELFVVKRHAE